MIKAIGHSHQRCLTDCLPFSYVTGKRTTTSTAQNRSTIMAKLYPLYPAVLGQNRWRNVEGKGEEKGKRRGEGRREGRREGEERDEGEGEEKRREGGEEGNGQEKGERREGREEGKGEENEERREGRRGRGEVMRSYEKRKEKMRQEGRGGNS